MGEARIDLSDSRPTVCVDEISWSPDSSAVLIAPPGAYPNGSGKIYLWPVSASEPTFLVDGNYPAWSPDSRRIAHLVPPGDTQPVSMMLVDRSGVPLWAAPVGLGGIFPEGLSWLTDDVLIVTYTRYQVYYGAANADVIAEWSDDMAANFLAQPGSLSPDGRWLVLEHRSMGSDDSYPPYARYVVYDTAAPGRSFELSAVFDDVLQFLAWSPDSSRFYFVSRPIRDNAILDPRTPFGLMTYEPQGGRMTMLFDQAVDALLSPDGRWVLVAFPSQDGTEQGWLAAGVWQLGTETLIGRERISDELVFAHPTETRLLQDAAWSPDSSHVAFVNTAHQLVVIDTVGSIQRLSACVSVNSWSPDGKRLLVDHIQWVQSTYSDLLTAELLDDFLLLSLPLPQDYVGLACP
jgi:Tol biopolymer transport system component